MSDFITFKLWKLGLFFVGAVIYGFIAARRRRQQSRRSESED
jgi:hypothetical protein